MPIVLAMGVTPGSDRYCRSPNAFDGGSFTIGNGSSSDQTEKLREILVDIQRCRAPDPHGWVYRVL
jgi:hypothetical protein